MRSDETIDAEIRNTPDWDYNFRRGERDPAITARYGRGREKIDGQTRWHSFSGNERNHLFLNLAGERFTDISALSGLDNIADGRSWALCDVDRDGWQDVALVNANQPLLSLYRNEIEKLADEPDSRIANCIAIRLRGGSTNAQPTRRWTNRDGYGAKVIVRLGETEILREHRSGEGFAAQNSGTMIIGIGAARGADRVLVRWPSGIESSTRSPVAAGTLLTCYEDASRAPGGEAFARESYRPDSPIAYAALGVPTDSDDTLPCEELVESTNDPPDLFVLTTMATWCTACKSHLPQHGLIKDSLGDRIRLYGVPIDPIESDADLRAYSQENQPAYQLLTTDADSWRRDVQELLHRHLKGQPLPSTIVTDGNGKVLDVFPGVPNVSQLRKLLRAR